MERLCTRIFRGKVSPVTTHATGPQVEAKNKMKIQMKAMPAFCAVALSTAM